MTASGSASPASEPESGWLITARRPVATLMIVFAIAVTGWISLQRLPVELMPEITYPTLTVRALYEGAAPEEVEESVVRPIEELVRTVEGVVGVESIARAGNADVILRFGWGTNLDDRTQKVRERLALAPLPDEVAQPSILRYDPALDPILRLGLTSDAHAAGSLRTFAEEEIRRRLEQLDGVAAIRVEGGEEEVIRVELREAALTRYRVSVADVSARLQAENVRLAGGRLRDGDAEYLVRTLNEFHTPEELGRLVIRRDGEALLRLEDLAEVRRGTRRRTNLTRVDGSESIEIAVYKEADADLVALSEAIKRTLYGASQATARSEDRPDAFAANLPEGMELLVLSDPASYVRAAIVEVSRTAILGALFAVLVLFFFLRRLSATLIIGLAIPLSIVATFIPLRSLGVSLNIMSLGGLALGIGMLVDNAIVVLESIVRCREEGDGELKAAFRGTREVAGAVTASTLTTLAVFVPILFVDGIAGQLFGDLAIAVVLALLASLAFALFFVPMLSALPAELRLRRAAAHAREEIAETPGPIATLRDDLRSLGQGLRSPALGRRLFTILIALPALAWILVRTLLWLPFPGVGWVVERLFFAPLRASGGPVRRGGGRLLAVLVAPITALSRVLMDAMASGYATLLGGALRRPGLVVVLLALLVGATWHLYPQVGIQLLPELAQGELRARVELPVGTPLDETARTLAQLEARLLASPSIDRVFSAVGDGGDRFELEERGEHIAELAVIVARDRDVVAADARAVEALRTVLAGEPGIRWEVRRPSLFALSAPLAVEIRGYGLEGLQRTADEVVARAAAIPELTDVRSSARPGFPEIRVVLDRERLAALGIEVRDVAEAIRGKVQGVRATDIPQGERRLDVEVLVRPGDAATLEDLRQLTVAWIDPDRGEGVAAFGGAQADAEALLGAGATADSGAAREDAIPVALQMVAEVRTARGPAEIRRLEGRRAVVVEGSTSLLDLGRAASALQESLRALPLESGQSVRLGGQSTEVEEARRALLQALLLAIFLVYVVLASQFESFRAPLLILLTIPLALSAVVLLLAWTGTPLSVIALIGAIVLTGIIVNNAIVLVDAMIRLERRGMTRRDAVQEACAMRLRPVLITATTTLLGLLPMALGLGEGAELRRPLAWVVIVGLAAGTALTLLVIPVAHDRMGGQSQAPVRDSAGASGALADGVDGGAPLG